MNTDKPLVSIILAAYNEEKYIRESIESIYKSTYTNFEVICIDDGSVDGTADICKEYSDKNNNFFYYRQENAGLAYSRNVGLGRAKGYFVTFVDADDCIHENMIEYLMRQIKKYHADIAYTKLKMFNGKYNSINNGNNGEVEVCLPKDALIRYFDSNKGNVCGGIFKKALFKGIKFPNGLIYEDNVVKTYLLVHSPKTIFSNTYYYFYRVNRNSITRKKSSIKNLDIFKIVYMQHKILKKDFKNQYREVKSNYYQMVSGMIYCVLDKYQLDNAESKVNVTEYVPIPFFLTLLVCGLRKESLDRIILFKKAFKIFNLK